MEPFMENDQFVRDKKGRFKKGIQQHSPDLLSEWGKRGTIARLAVDPDAVAEIARKNIAKANDKRLPEWEEKRLLALKSSKRAKLAAVEVSRRYKEKRLATRSKNPRSAKGVQHGCSTVFHLRDPNNREYHFKNLADFIRKNENLFLPDDVKWKSIGESGENCRAYQGLLSLRPFLRDGRPKPRVEGTWKGWTWISNVEVFLNAGDDLLLRPTI